MKKYYIPLMVCSALFSGLSLSSCADKAHTIRISASELPHADILNNVVKDIVEEKGFKLKVSVLDWSIQNDALANDEYDANYFQHTLYLNTYGGKTKLASAAKIHYEQLCMYASSKETNKKLDNGEKITLVNDLSNVERALKLLESNDILTINPSNYDEKGNFTHFDVTNPNNCVTFKEAYNRCTLTCLSENTLCTSLPDFHFGIIPGNTALTGLGPNFKNQVVYKEVLNDETKDNLTNIIAVKEANLNTEKTKVLVEAFSDTRVKDYIESKYGEVVKYNFKSLIE